MKYLIPLFLILFSCSPLKRHNRIVKNHPYVHTEVVDTIRDTTYIPSVKHDTIVHKDFDTVRLEKERLKVQVVRVRDSVYIEGECKDTTIIKSIPYAVYRSTKQPFNIKPFLYLVLFMVFGYFLLKLAMNRKS